jgi:hypothetical protein
MKLVALAALLALATMPTPQHAYACNTANCATDDSTATQVPAATDQTGKAQTACVTPNCARPDDASEPANSAAKGDRLDRGVQQACPSSNCATPEPAPTQVATTPQSDRPARAVASLSPGGAALSKAVRAIKERIRQQRAGCVSPNC